MAEDILDIGRTVLLYVLLKRTVQVLLDKILTLILDKDKIVSGHCFGALFKVIQL